MLNVNDSIISQDIPLKVTLVAFDPNGGKGQMKVEELSTELGRFYINVKFGAGGASAVDYRMGDVLRRDSPLYEIGTLVKNDTVASIELTRLE